MLNSQHLDQTLTYILNLNENFSIWGRIISAEYFKIMSMLSHIVDGSYYYICECYIQYGYFRYMNLSLVQHGKGKNGNNVMNTDRQHETFQCCSALLEHCFSISGLGPFF